MDRRSLLKLGVGSATLAALSSSIYILRDKNHIEQEFHFPKSNAGNVISGRNAGEGSDLTDCIVLGNYSARFCKGYGSEFIGSYCGYKSNLSLSTMRGEYTGNYVIAKNSICEGYAIEYCNLTSTTAVGLYAAHSASLIDSSAKGVSCLINAIGTRLTAQGRDAGAGAEGENLTMIGAGVSTAFVAGTEHEVTVEPSSGVAQLEGDLAFWVIPDHGWKIGSRRNFSIRAQTMPENQTGARWIFGSVYPFTVHDKDRLIYTGNKYVATTTGQDVYLVENANRPRNSTAIGAGSVITGSDQFIVNGKVLS